MENGHTSPQANLSDDAVDRKAAESVVDLSDVAVLIPAYNESASIVAYSSSPT